VSEIRAAEIKHDIEVLDFANWRRYWRGKVSLWLVRVIASYAQYIPFRLRIAVAPRLVRVFVVEKVRENRAA